MSNRVSEHGYIQKPPHLSAGARRRYAKLLDLPAEDPRRELLLSFYRVWACSGSVELYEGGDLQLHWGGMKPPTSETRSLDLEASFFVYAPHPRDLFDAWTGHGPDSPLDVEKRYRESLRDRAMVCSVAYTTAFDAGLFNFAELFAERLAIIACIARCVAA